MQLTDLGPADGDVVITAWSWWGLVPLTREQAVALMVGGWSTAPLWSHQLVIRAGGLKPWCRRRPLARRRADGNRASWTPEVTR